MRRIIPLLAAAALAACGSDITAPSASGIYLLKSVDGAPLPAATTKLFAAPTTVMNGTVTLETNGSWSADIFVSLTVDGQSLSQTLHQAGTYTINGTNVTFNEAGSPPATATLVNRRITVEQEGAMFVFEQQASSKSLAQFDAVWAGYDAIYPYFEFKKVNWDSLRSVYRPRAALAKSTGETVAILREMIGALKDVHSWFVQPSGSSLGTHESPRFVNWRRSLWEADVQRHQNFPQQTNWGYAMIGDVPYVYFGAWNRSQVKTADVDAIFERFRNAPAIVIDVRANGGGDESLAQEVAGRFYDQPHIYRYGANRNGPRHADMETPHPMVLAPRGSWQFTRPVLVLAGRGSFSATEDFVCMMRVLPHVTIAGDTTGGGSGNPGFYDMGDGWQYSVPRSIGYTSAMQIVEWNGIAPTIVVPMSSDDVARARDTVFEFAEEWARARSRG
jgi:hypothetical protein